MLEWGDKAEWLREVAPDSPALAAQPEIGKVEEFVWDMFWTLHAGRQVGMNGYQAIPLVEIMAYCALAGVGDPSDRMALVRLMQAMDRALLEVMAKKQERQRSK